MEKQYIIAVTEVALGNDKLTAWQMKRVWK